MQELGVPAAILVASSMAIAAFLLPAGLAKLTDVPRFVAGVRDYAILPTWLVSPVARLVPILESCLGVALLLGVTPGVVGLISALLLALVTAAVIMNLRRGRIIDCNCHGFAATKRIGSGAVARNVLLLSLAIELLVVTWTQPAAAGWSGVWRSTALPATLVALLMMATCCVAGIYLTEWAFDTRSRASAAAQSLRGGRS
jgi:hypothetical protein